MSRIRGQADASAGRFHSAKTSKRTSPPEARIVLASPNWGVRSGGNSRPLFRTIQVHLWDSQATLWQAERAMGRLWEGELQHEAARIHFAAQRGCGRLAAKGAGATIKATA